MGNEGGVNAVEQAHEIYRSMLFSLQRGCSAADRERIADVFAEVVNRTLGYPLSDDGIEGAAMLATEGCYRPGRLLSSEQASDVRRHFAERPCYNGHAPNGSDGVPRRCGEGAERFHYGSYRLEDILEAPHLLEVANSPRLLAIAGRYLGCTPTLYSMNVWWSFADQASAAKYAQSFHRDLDDFRFCTLFIYLTDVDQAGGPHVFVRRTHKQPLVRAHLEGPGVAGLRRFSPEDQARLLGGVLFEADGYGSDPIIETLFGDLIDTVVGPAGTAILADTSAFHKGVPPQGRHRLMCWARYGLYASPISTTPSMSWRQVSHRLPPTDRLRYINRQILAD
jgi:hypothetical protein